MATDRPLSYQATGILDNAQLGLSALLKWVNATSQFRVTGTGRRVVDVGAPAMRGRGPGRETGPGRICFRALTLRVVWMSDTVTLRTRNVSRSSVIPGR